MNQNTAMENISCLRKSSQHCLRTGTEPFRDRRMDKFRIKAINAENPAKKDWNRMAGLFGKQEKICYNVNIE